MSTRDEVVDFLNLFKGCIMVERMSVRDREKNRQALIDLGITPDQRREILLGLVPEDYHAGPEPDDTDDTKEVWKFGCDMGGTEVYVKLRVVQDPRKKNVWRGLVWSFHPAKRSMRYPLRGGGQ